MTQGRAADGGGPPNGTARPAGNAPTNGPIRRTITIINPRGLHPRTITPFTRTANQFASAVTLWNGDLKADGKSVMDLICLVAEYGTEVVLEVDGPDAPAAVEPLAAILAAPGGEDFADEAGAGI
jgi:phosphotransferase system HPr (HPr) family protein